MGTGGDEKSDLASLAGDIGVRIVNNAPDDAFTRGNCPLGTRECCFASNVNLNTFGSSCAPPGQTPLYHGTKGARNEIQTLVANNVDKDSTHLFKTLRKVKLVLKSFHGSA